MLVNDVANRATTDTLNNPTSPILPLEAVNANPTNNPNAPDAVPVLRGVGFRGGTYADTANVLPLTSAPATELSAPHAPFQSSVFFPIRPWFVNYVDALVSGGSGVTRLDITPTQYISSSPGSQFSTQRSFNSMAFRLYYSDNVTNYAGNVPALAAPPVITNVTSTVNGNTVTFSAHVTGAPYAGIQGVWVTYTGNASGDPGYGQWQSLDLVQDFDQLDAVVTIGRLRYPGQRPLYGSGGQRRRPGQPRHERRRLLRGWRQPDDTAEHPTRADDAHPVRVQPDDRRVRHDGHLHHYPGDGRKSAVR